MDVEPMASSLYLEAVMGEHQVTISFEVSKYTELKIGDYITFEGIKYSLNKLPAVKKISTRLYQYTAIFQPPRYDMLKVMYMLFDNTDTPAQSEFSLTGTADMFVDLLISNMNRVSDGWLKGEVVETEYVTISFNSENCHSVMEKLAQHFETEFHVLNKTVNLRKLTTERELTLEYGSTSYDIERLSVNSQDVITRLYPFGADKNISSSYRDGSKRLLIPSPDSYIESENTELYGVIEQSKVFDDVFPRLSLLGAGIVAVVGDKYTFSDPAIDFNVNDCLTPGVPAKVRFVTGECAGFDFEIRSFNNATKTFVVLENQNEKDLILPTDLLKPAPGDKYVLLDVIMPPAYVAAAEAELKTRAEAWLSGSDTPRVDYRVFFSSLYAKKNLPVIQCADTVRVYDADLGVDEDIRIVKLQKGVRESYNIQVDLSNTVSQTRIERIEGGINDINNQIVVSNEENKRRGLEAYRRTRELQDMVFDPDGFFDAGNIRPLSIEAGMIAVGAKSQQYQLTSVLQPNYNANPQSIYWSAGVLSHFSLHESTIVEWVIASGNITITGANQTKALYIYARCSRTLTTGDIYLSPTAVKIDSDQDYWLFLIGVLHSPSSGVRGISLSYGQTTINGQFVKTGIISSLDGLTYFNLNDGEIGGNIKFRNAFGNIEDINSALAALLINSQSYSNSLAAGLQLQIDGVIDSWFYPYTPTAANFPASDWTTQSLKNKHVGDTFTNTLQYDPLDPGTFDAGKSWRWVFDEATTQHKWTPISDSDAVLALQRAALAQDTADHKRRVFTSQPVTPYEAGDLWTQGAFGDLMVCQTERLTGSYISLDWKKASKYTDDTTANEAWDYADAVAGELAGLEVGGENVAEVTELAFSAPSQVPPDSNNSIFKFITKDIFTFPDAEAAYLKNGQSYVLTISESIKLSGTATRYSVVIYDFSTQQFSSNLYESFAFSSNKQIIKFTTPVSGNWSLLIYAGVNNSTAGNSVEYKGIMLQEGNKETTYQMATKYLTNVIKNGYTDVYGGLLATNVIFFKNALEQVTGGVSGLDEDNIGFWTGGTYLQALANTAKIILRKDGSGQLAGGGIKWNALATLVEFVGKIIATSGQIGGLTISENSLMSGSMTFAEEAVEALSTLKTPVTYQITNDTTWSDEAIGSSQAHAYTQDIVIGLDSILKFRASATPDTIMSECGWEIYIEKAGGGRVYQHSGSGSLSLTLFQIPIKSGTYTLHVLTTGYMYLGESYYNEASIAGEAATPTVIKAYGFLYKTKIGNNGLFSFWGDANYLYYSASHGLEYKGTMNIPGVLAGGSVLSGGTQNTSLAWGAKKNTGTADRTGGTYTVPHSIGHANFTVQLTSHTPTRIPFIIGRTSTTFTVQVRDQNNTEQQSGFDYLIIGEN